jgi:glycosyltransferase involved in cell wall biosynthesis
MNILHLTIGHSAFDDRIFYKEATSLGSKHNILVLAYNASGALKTMGNEYRSPGVYNNVNVDSFGKCSLPVRVLRRLGLLPFPLREVRRVLRRHNFDPDAIHCHEILSLRLAIKLKSSFGSRLVFDVHEFFFGYCFDKYGEGIMGDLSFAMLRRSYKYLLQNVDVTISVNDIIRSVNAVLNPNARHLLVPNAFILQDSDGAIEKIPKFVLVHEGTLNFGRGLKNLLEVFENDWIRDNCILKIVGELHGREEKYLKDLSDKRPYLRECVSITGWVDYEQLHQHLSGDVGMITMQPKVNNMLAGPPNKLFNYVWAGMPICTYDLPASSSLVKKFNIGLVSERSTSALASTVRNLCESIEVYRSNVARCRENFSFGHFVDELESAYL